LAIGDLLVIAIVIVIGTFKATDGARVLVRSRETARRSLQVSRG
jgi:hypothetical protein